MIRKREIERKRKERAAKHREGRNGMRELYMGRGEIIV